MFDWRPLAVRATRGIVTVGAMWGHLDVDDMLVRTAYEPDGNGEVFESSSDLWQGSAAVDLVPWLRSQESAWRWVVGLNVHLYDEKLGDTRSSVWDLDAATTLAWTPVTDEHQRLSVSLGAMLHNLSRGTMDFDEVSSRLPRYLHVGLAMELELGPTDPEARRSRVSLLAAWQRDPDHQLADSEHLGVELVLADLVALRMGHRDGGFFHGEGWSWGGGLSARLPWGRDVRVSVDYAHVGDETSGFDEGMDHWTLGVGTALPR